LLNALMWSLLIVESRKRLDDAMYLIPIEKQELVQALPLQGADEAFTDGVGLHRQLHPN